MSFCHIHSTVMGFPDTNICRRKTCVSNGRTATEGTRDGAEIREGRKDRRTQLTRGSVAETGNRNKKPTVTSESCKH